MGWEVDRERLEIRDWRLGLSAHISASTTFREGDSIFV
jgi:hypothetical protein